MRPLLLLLALAPQDPAGPLPPAEAAKALRLDPGLRIELAAADPEVSSPVSIAFDEDGRLWVAEMLDYPNPIPGKAPQGRIRRLEDRDGDGRYEHSVVFADGILMVNGVMPWKGGVIVTAAPSILYLKDTDGDGKADVREPIYVGFAEANPQLRVSHPNLGIDNWIYVANGQRGGKITRPGSSAPAVDIGGQDFRFDLLRGRHEAVTGFGQFGLTFDDWGQRFVCTNRNHLIHLPMPNRYFARNPFLAPPAASRDNQGAGGAARVFPLSKNKTLAASHAGTFTAACGVTIYRGDLLPEPYRGGAFTCEPTGNLVRLEILKQAGATFDARPHREGVEFLASPDAWFRPVSLANGPDGSLYVVDMVRSEVEHPEWVPKDQQHRYDFDGRRDLGRIWRIVPERHGRNPFTPLGGKTGAELVALLESPNGWTRMTAHRLLLERQDEAAAGPLRKLVSSGGPLARVHAAWLLEGLGKLEAAHALDLMAHPHPRVRENGLVLAERFIGDPKAVEERLLALAEDPDPRVRFQAALSLGACGDERVLGALASIAEKGAQDRWTRLAVASAVSDRSGELLTLVSDPAMMRDLATLAGSRRDAKEVDHVLSSLLLRDRPRQLAVLNGLAEGMGRRGAQLSKVLERFDGHALSKKLAELLREIASVAEDPKAPAPERQEAVRFLAHLPWETARPALERLLEDPSQDVRISAAGALSAHKRPEVGPLLMKSWKSQMPAMKREVLEAMSRQPERLEFLLGEVEAGRLAGGELGPTLVKSLSNHGNAAIKARAQKALQGNLPEERQKVLDRYKASLAIKGDAKRGREIFQKNCVACHRVAGLGTNVGPDVSDTLSKTPEALMVDILDPSRVIDNNYANYLVKTKSGAVLSGFIAVQTASSLTLRRGEGQEDVVLRQDIEEMRSSGVSLMPEGLEKNVTVEQLADLIAFLKFWRDLPPEPGERN